MTERALNVAIARASIHTGVPADLLLDLIAERAESPQADGLGPFGFSPSGWERWGAGDPTDPLDAAVAAGRYLLHALRRLGQSAASARPVSPVEREPEPETVPRRSTGQRKVVAAGGLQAAVQRRNEHLIDWLGRLTVESA